MQPIITFTGIDVHTNIDNICQLQDHYPFIEFGLLVAQSRQGKENRYPDLYVLPHELEDRGLNLACHVCGSLAKECLTEGFDGLNKYLGGKLNIFNRVQLNVSDMREIPPSFNLYLDYGPDEVIIQQHPDKPLIVDRLANYTVNVSVLFDASGGRGLETGFKPVRLPKFRTGYAGGINPTNAAERFFELTESDILDDFWIDMESGVRTDDWFDISKVKAVLESICQHHKMEQLSKKGSGFLGLNARP